MTAIAYDADALCSLLRQANAKSLEHSRLHMTGLDLAGVELQAECLPAKETFVRVIIAARECGHPDALLGALAGAMAWWMIDHVLMNVGDQPAAYRAALANLENGLKGQVRPASYDEIISVSGIPARRA